ncbi:peptidase dimerization domain-containing protein [Sediminibacterium sp.]|uniref:peptidase dimerization domain-containing protein n=1 Tax=Sediminibacterium sp. TaxID=1917865 RepID=UPI0025DB9E12|nr:peptidase dimerization domain-containing protein [Sediminibacterium sp.]MDP2421810.1 peptidase dimerization domain-containing protein [Sediminibacterium sp.]
MHFKKLFLPIFLLVFTTPIWAQKKAISAPSKVELLKKEVLKSLDDKKKNAQEMVDMVFSFSELGFQETESSAYLINILEKNGFTIEKGIAGIPTAWMAKWGNGKPVIALGSDIDGIPKASQKPGVAYKEPIVEDAPGHGEGHNSGLPLVILSAIEVKKVMEREGLSGTLMIWPGVAEELVGSKAWYIRDGYFKNVDACIFTHVSSNLGVSWGDAGNNGLVSVEFKFEGSSAHSAGAPWRGKSALDAVELMDIAWNFKREHLKPTQRSHYVITDGGDQPNVVPSKASVWYYLRERTYEDIKSMYDEALLYAKSVATMTGTKVSHQLLGTAWPGHFNKSIAEAVYKNITQVGLPTWDSSDQQLARAVQKLVNAPKKNQRGAPIDGLATKLDTLNGPVQFSMGGGSDDIADIAWNVPTVVLRYPSNIPGTPGHNWADGIAMATPIAHKGVVSGSKVVAATLLDMFTNPTIIENAWDYHKNVQTKDVKYIPFVEATTPPAIHLNKKIMDQFRPQLKKYYYDPSKYKTYLEQLGIQYPQLEKKGL